MSRTRPKTKAAAPEPAKVLGKDLRRIASCAGENGNHPLAHIELSPLGLTASDGRFLCVLNAPGWPYQCYFESQAARAVDPESAMAVNGAVEFVSAAPGKARVALPHKNPDEVHYPRWQRLLPDASSLVPAGTFDAALLRKLLAALQREPHGAVTLYARSDDAAGAVLLANEAGDLGILMPMIAHDGESAVFHFPAQVYRALGKDARTEPPLAQPMSRFRNDNGRADTLLADPVRFHEGNPDPS